MDFIRGQLVRSKAGRDKTRILAVLAVDGPMLWLADGNLRKVGDPKRKKNQACSSHVHCSCERASEKRSITQ